MQAQDGRLIPALPGTFRDVYAVPPLESPAEGAARGSDQNDQIPEGDLFDIMSIDMNSWSLTLPESFADVMQSWINGDAEIHTPVEHIDQLEQDQTNNVSTNSTLGPDASASSQLPSSEAPQTIHAEHQSYSCSWCHEGSDAECHHVAPDRPAFLRHLGGSHQVSGAPNETIVCHLLDSKTRSACKRSIKRGNFPRHVDTHYRLRYDCQYCATDRSFSRQDSWKNHIRTMHVQSLPTL